MPHQMILSAAIGLIAFLIGNYDSSKNFAEDTGIADKLRIFLPSAIKDSKIETLKYDGIVEMGLYVDRPSL